MQLYLPLAQAPGGVGANSIAIRAATGRVDFVSARSRDVIVNSLGRWAIPRVASMSEILAPELRPWRLAATLFSAAGLLALLVAAVGAYSTIAYSVSLRTHEMGVRAALGARALDLVRLIVGEGVRIVAIGIVVGAGLVLVLGRVVSSMLYKTSPGDPIVLAVVALTLLAVAVVACLVPARRATRVDPVEALRAE